MNNQILLEKISAQLGSKLLKHEESYGMLCIEVDRSDLVNTVSWLMNDDSIRMTFLTDLCGLHYPDNKGSELGVAYHLHSLENNQRLRVKTFFPIEDPTCPSLTPLFSGANWMERETYDFYGIQFQGHPSL